MTNFNTIFQEELDLNPQKERELCNQSAEKKWLMIMEQQIRQVSSFLIAYYMYNPLYFQKINYKLKGAITQN